MENGMIDSYLSPSDGAPDDGGDETTVWNVETFCRDFRDAYDDTQDERLLAQKCRDYYDGDQVTEDEAAVLRKRKQPIVVYNRIGPKIDSLIGHEKRMRTDPKAYPRVPSKEDDANSATDALRFICQDGDFDTIRSATAENLFVEGIGAGKLVVDTTGDKPRIYPVWIPWDRFYRDPRSRLRDFGDAAYLGEVIWMYEQDAMEEFGEDNPEAEAILSASYSDYWDTGTYGDKPKFSWADSRRKRVMVMHHRFRHEGGWWECVFTRGGFLVEPHPAEYLDEEGKPDCDIVATSAYITQNNLRYGIVKRHLDPQDEINKRRSKALHILNTQQIITEEGSVKDHQQARQEVAKPDGYIIVKPNKRFEINRNEVELQGHIQLLAEAKAEIDAIGVNPSLGGDASAPSGRAQELLQQAGLTEYAKVFEAISKWSWTMYRKMWFRVRQYWTAEMWVRVTDDERNLRWVHLNHPLTLREAMQMQADKDGVSIVQIAHNYAMNTGILLGPNSPELDEVIRTQNDIGDLSVDIIMEDAPETVTIQAEQFKALIDLKRADPTAISTKSIIQASSLRNKDQILRDLETTVPPQVQQQIQQLQQQLQKSQQDLIKCQQQLQAAKNKSQVDAAEVQANKDTDDQQLEIQRYQAETARIAALKPLPLEAVPLGWPADQQVPGNYARGTVASHVAGSSPSMRVLEPHP